MLLSAKGNGCICTPKGNGIKDGFVSWVCVYAVVFWMLRFTEAILHVYFIFLNGLVLVLGKAFRVKFDCQIGELLILSAPAQIVFPFKKGASLLIVHLYKQ